MKRFAVILSGCGFKDGSEITEAVCIFLALSELEACVVAFSPDKEIKAINHVSDKAEEKRNTLYESTRIYRKPVLPLNELKIDDFHGLIFPGGYGAVIHLCDFAQKGADCKVDSHIERIIRDFHAHSKPIGALCIAPALVSKVLGDQKVSVTIGEDKAVSEEIEKTGAHHILCPVMDFVTDRENKLVTTPAYMYDKASPFEVYTGIRKAVREIFEMA